MMIYMFLCFRAYFFGGDVQGNQREATYFGVFYRFGTSPVLAHIRRVPQLSVFNWSQLVECRLWK